MYLKSIEIQGFKSFANKILFEFHNGITGIVGPNGSGKSNVADAVRWVLGEQRIKQLRGSNMQDVIFSGTEMRKPQGFAYVAITLDNADKQLAIDYEEVTVSRRIYRSGESEYRINGTICRLRDINELFYDTGIGKEGYSIIGQGQIDRILSSKPEDRRELFDEAAGIVKFKRRKNLAVKKLEDEKQNLVRVKDILAELEKQVGPLKRQSEAAREYLRLKEDLKVNEANQFLLETGELKDSLKGMDERLGIVTDELTGADQEGISLTEEHEKLEVIISQLDGEIEDKKNKLTDMDMGMENRKGQINVLNEQIHTEEKNQEHIEDRQKTITKESEEHLSSLRAYEGERAEIKDKLQAFNQEQEEKAIILRRYEEHIQRLSDEIEEIKGSIIEGLNEKASLTARSQRYETMLEQVLVRRSEVSNQLLKLKSDESIQDEAILALNTSLGEIGREIEEYLNEQVLMETSIQEREESIRLLTIRINEQQQDYHRAYTKLESLRNIAERYDGYGNSIRRVMEVRDRIHGIHGVVADLISTEKQYEVAIETALGGSIQNIVTDTDQTAKQLIEYLKKNRFGRATFLPLNSINGRTNSNQGQVLKERGVLGMANELVAAKEQYQGLLTYLLGRIVVVDNIDNALALARKYRYSLRIVTLEGELLNAGGSMTGGAFKNTSNLLGRRREIEELEKELNKIRSQADELAGKLKEEESGLQSISEGLKDVAKQLQEKRIRQNTLSLQSQQAQEKKTELVESSQDLLRESGQLAGQLKDIEESKAALMNDTRNLDEQQQNSNTSIEALTADLENEQSSKTVIQEALNQLNLEISGYAQKDSFQEENIRRIRGELKKLHEEKDGLIESLAECKEAIALKEAEIRLIEQELGALMEARQEGEALLSRLHLQKEGELNRQKENFKKREEVRERKSLLDKELFRLQNQKEKLEEKIDSLTSYMWNEYELTYQGARAYQWEEEATLAGIKKVVDGLKGKIRSMGHVNVNAIEDYKDVSERFEFMSVQHDDLVEAEKQLTEIIAELDAGMRRQFEEKFKDIKQEFDKVFKALFGGGRGTLELVDGEDILEAGIQIISQPPGKKLQNMMQLSGGEKALTAISLLFAIQNLKPSPFCLLDEIEAALDDSNVGRFAGYLHKLTKNTQFIIITHRRGTMVASDRLYGITMQEKGVSTLVSVNLIEDELDE